MSQTFGCKSFENQFASHNILAKAFINYMGFLGKNYDSNWDAHERKPPNEKLYLCYSSISLANMKCPKCSVKFGKPTLVAKPEAVRGFGNMEFARALETEYILYHNGEYRCTRCGYKFSEREAYLHCV